MPSAVHGFHMGCQERKADGLQIPCQPVWWLPGSPGRGRHPAGRAPGGTNANGGKGKSKGQRPGTPIHWFTKGLPGKKRGTTKPPTNRHKLRWSRTKRRRKTLGIQSCYSLYQAGNVFCLTPKTFLVFRMQLEPLLWAHVSLFIIAMKTCEYFVRLVIQYSAFDPVLSPTR